MVHSGPLEMLDARRPPTVCKVGWVRAGVQRVEEGQGNMGEGQQPAVLIVTVEVAEEDVDQLNRWYEEDTAQRSSPYPGT